MAPRRLDLLALSAQRHTLLAARVLEAYSKNPSLIGQKKRGVSYAFFSSRPVDNVMAAAGRFRWLLLVLVIAALVRSTVDLVDLETMAAKVERFPHYRFVNLEARDGSPPATPGISEFGLMLHGEGKEGGISRMNKGAVRPCKTKLSEQGVFELSGATMMLSLPEGGSPYEGPFEMWYIRTLDGMGTEGMDSVRFILEGSRDQQTWTQVGSSNHMTYRGQVFFNDGRADTPKARGAILVLDTSLPLGIALPMYLVCIFFLSICVSLLISIAGRRPKKSILAVLWIQAVLRLCCAIAIAEVDRQMGQTNRHEPYIGHLVVTGLSFGVAGLWTAYMEEVYELMMIFVGLANVICQVSLHRKTHNRQMTPAEVSRLMPLGTLWLMLGVVMSCLRALAMRRAVLGIQQGKASYNEVFQRVSLEQQLDLARLQVTVAEIRDLVGDKEARQLVRDTTVPQQRSHFPTEAQSNDQVTMAPHTMDGSMPSPRGAWGYLAVNVLQSEMLHETMLRYSHQAADTVSVPVQSLDQLHAQAFLVYEIFLDVVVRLGKDYKGHFRLKSPTASEEKLPFAPWNGGPVSRGRFQLGGIKSVQSCVAKLDVAYGGDVTRLLDVCRETLFFKQLKHLEACLKAIVSDRELEIVRIKNTMLDSTNGGGDKDIGQVQTQEMRDLYREWRTCKRVMTTLWRSAAWAKETLYSLPCLSSRVSSKISPLAPEIEILVPKNSSSLDRSESGGDWGAMSELDGNDRSLDELVGVHSVQDPVSPQGAQDEFSDKIPQALSRRSPGRGLQERSSLSETPTRASFEVGIRTSLHSSRDQRPSSPTAKSLPERGPVKPFFKQDVYSDKHPDRYFSRSTLGAARKSDDAIATQARTAAVASERETDFVLSTPLASKSDPAIPTPLDARAGFQVGIRPWHRSSKSARSCKSGGSDIQVMEPIDERCGTPDSTSMQKVMGWLNGVAGEDRDYEWDGGETSWGLAVSGQMEELLEGLCRMSALGISDFLDRRFDKVRNDTDISFSTSSLGSIVYTTQPVSALLQRRPVQIFCLIISGVLMWDALQSKFAYDRNSRGIAFGPFEHYRLETILTRNGSQGTDISSPGLSDFGVLGPSKCAPNVDPMGFDDRYDAVLSTHGRSIVATYPEGVEMTGWFLETGASEGSQGDDPSFFIVWATNDPLVMDNATCSHQHGGLGGDHWWDDADVHETTWCGAKWVKVGASSWRYSASAPGPPGPGGPFWYWIHVPVPLSLERGHDGFQSFVLDPAWHEFMLFYFFPDCFSASGLALGAVAGFLGREILSRRSSACLPGPMPHYMLGGCLYGSVISVLLQSAWMVADGVTGEALHTFGAGICLILLPTGMLLANAGNSRPLFLSLLWSFAILENIRLAIMSLLWFHDPFHVQSMAGLGTLAFVLFATLLRLKSLWSSSQILRQTRFRYDSLWNELLSSKGGKEAVEHLHRVVGSMVVRDFLGSCRQYNRLRSPAAPSQTGMEAEDAASGGVPIHPLFQNLGLFTIPDAMNTESRVTSCNQLFCQAAIANLLLIDRLKEWADLSQGFFYEASSEGGQRTFVKWSDVKGNSAAARSIHWTPMKRHVRCIEKMLRAYDNDPSRLLDISRGFIAFESLGDLTSCLEAIWADENVVVSGITNRMNADFNGSDTGGYRDVSINLRLVSSEARALGAELHVCEVLLLLKGYAQLRSEDQVGFVRARDSRGS